MAEVLSDRPIESPENDRFGRDKFAKAIASALVLPEGSPSIVVAIEGEWGTGKTSVLNLVEEHLSHHPDDPFVIRLDAWLLGGSDSALSTFLVQVAAELGSKDHAKMAAEAAEKILKLSKLIAPVKFIPVVGSAASIAQGAVQAVGEGTKALAEAVQRDVKKKKRDVAKSLQEMARPIVIIIDDLDRLEPEEVRGIFRLVKAVADFDRVAYLLSYDPGPVQRALSYDGVYDGASFLEKIVQVAYPLPRPSYWDLKRYLESRLKEFMLEFKFEDFEQARLSELLSTGGLTHALRHPRDVSRLINRLRVSVPPTRGEVNFADIVGFEALSIIYPDVASTIRRRPYDFVGGRNFHEDTLAADYMSRFREPEQANSRKLPEWIEALWKNLPEERQKPLVSLLDFIFPGFTGDIFVVRHYSDEHQERELLICRAIPLLRLLSVGPTVSTFSVGDVKEFFQDPDLRKAMLNDIYGEEGYSGWLSYASLFLGSFEVCDVRQLLSLFLDKAAEFGMSRDRDEIRKVIDEMANFILRLLGAIPQDQVEGDLLYMMADQRSLTLTHEVVWKIARQHGLWKHSDGEAPDREKFVKQRDVVKEAIAVWLSSVRAKAADTDKFFAEPGILSILFRWGQLGSQSELREFLDDLVSTDAGVEKFVNLWPHGHMLSDMDYLLSDVSQFKLRFERHPRREAFRKDIWGYLDALEKKLSKSSGEKDEGFEGGIVES